MGSIRYQSSPRSFSAKLGMGRAQSQRRLAPPTTGPLGWHTDRGSSPHSMPRGCSSAFTGWAPGLHSQRASDRLGRSSFVPGFFCQLNPQLQRRGALALRMELAQRIELATTNKMMESFISTQFYPVAPIQPVRTILLDLTADEATLLARMKEKWRYNLRLAERKGVKVRAAQSVEDVQAWYNLIQITSERDQFGIHTLDYYLQAWRIFMLRQQGRLFLAECEGQLLAGIFVSLYAKQGIYLYGASSNEQRNLMPNYLLQWEAIRWAKAQGAKQYDFWGIPATDAEAEAMAGVYRFKSGWGGEVVRFVGCYQHVYHPRAMSLVQRFISI